METRTYECQYCKKEYVPKRRKVQRFCSNSCRVRSHQLRNREVKLSKPIPKKDKTKIDQISAAGAGNAALGCLIVKVGTNILTKEENMPATKKDIKELTSSLKRYHKIKNLPLNEFGQTPYFDLEKGEIIYLGISLPFKR